VKKRLSAIAESRFLFYNMVIFANESASIILGRRSLPLSGRRTGAGESGNAILAVFTKKIRFRLRNRAKNKNTKNRKIFIVQFGILMLS
jgi:hypothetical protein